MEGFGGEEEKTRKPEKWKKVAGSSVPSLPKTDIYVLSGVYEADISDDLVKKKSHFAIQSSSMVGRLVYASLVGQAKINGRMGSWGGAGDLKIICKIGNHPIKGRVGIFGDQKSSRAGLTLTD